MVLLSVRKMTNQSRTWQLTDSWAASPTLSPSLPLMFCGLGITSESTAKVDFLLGKKKLGGTFYSDNYGNKSNVPLRTCLSKINGIKHR